MLKAFVLVCVLASPSGGEQCFVIEDKWGPYTTEENCRIRLDQMGQEIFAIMSPLFFITSMDGACIPEEGQLS